MNTFPADKKKLRTCLLCSLVKTVGQFKTDGCDNCDSVLRLKGSIDRVHDCTSSTFQGLVCLMTEKSWVGKWQRIEKYHKGIYAIRISGVLPVYIQEELMDKGISYRPRDGSA
jgi:transcription elongation factor SPT4